MVKQPIFMTNAEKKCRELWRQCVKLRDRFCVICGWTPPELGQLNAHHIWFQSAGNWKVLFDIDFGTSLCRWCHLEREYAPHVDNEKFLEKILPRIKQDSPDRAAKIIKFLNEPKEVLTEKPCYAEIAGKLQLKFKELESSYWMNKDIDNSRGAPI